MRKLKLDDLNKVTVFECVPVGQCEPPKVPQYKGYFLGWGVESDEDGPGTLALVLKDDGTVDTCWPANLIFTDLIKPQPPEL